MVQVNDEVVDRTLSDMNYEYNSFTLFPMVIKYLLYDRQCKVLDIHDL